MSAWAGGLAAFGLPGWTCLVLLVIGGVCALLRSRRRPVVTLLVCLLAAGAVGGAAATRVAVNRSGVVGSLAADRAAVTLTAGVTGDPVLRTGRFGAFTLTRVTVTEVLGRGRSRSTRVPVLVIADESWAAVELGARVVASGRLAPPDGPDLAGVLSTGRPPRVLFRPGELLGGAAAVRAGIAASSVRGAAGRPRAGAGARGRGRPADVVAGRGGLPHLRAHPPRGGVRHEPHPGRRFLLVLARWAGVRARGLALVGVLGVLGFVLLARPEPSVLRAAAMGTVALVGMGSRGRDRGVRALGVAVFVLLLLDPWLALSVGFVLSTLATAGILFLGPPFRDALGSWLPRWAAEALAVPFAAQLACTPVVAAIYGQVSLVAVVANLVVAAALWQAAVLGLLGGVVMLVLPPLGHAFGRVAGLCASWIITVAVHLARLPTAAVDWARQA